MQLNTLGPLRLADATLSRPKPLLLLVYLALEGPKPRRYLADLFFRDARDPADALSTTLRRLLRGGDDVVRTADGFVSTPLRCDAQSVLDLLDAGQVDEAVTLYDAPFLSTLRLSLPPELEEWVFSTREHVAGRLRSAALTAAEAALDEADLDAAARYAYAAARLEGAPEHEPDELRRLHGVLLVTHPQRAARLRDEAKQLGLVLDGTRSAHPSSPLQPWHQPISPALPSPLVGRDVELLDIARALTQADCRLLCLHGPGGVGKTRLAIQVAYEQHQHDAFRDRTAFVALEALTLPTQIPHAIAAALSLPSLTGADAWGDLAAGLGTRQLLLVLDNFEHVRAAAPRLPRLLAACPGLVLLVTSRERLNLASEWVLTLDGLPIPERSMSLERALLSDALDLFVQRAKRTDLSFAVRAADLTHAIAICRAVDGFPLGLELAAGWVTTMPLTDIADTLARNPTELDASLRDVAPRHRSMNAVMEHSWSLLGSEDRDVLRRLAVFHGGFRRHAASSVAGASMTNLRHLVDKSLLRMSPTGRFERHVLLHQFIGRKLAEHPDIEALARERHGNYYIGLLRDASARAGAADFHEVFALLEEEEGNILACLDWAVSERRTEALLALADPLLWYFPMRGRFHEGAAIFARATAGLDEQDPASQEALAAYALGQSFLERFAGNLELALALALKAERMARASGSKRQLVRALNILGQAITFAGRYEEANAQSSPEGSVVSLLRPSVVG